MCASTALLRRNLFLLLPGLIAVVLAHVPNIGNAQSRGKLEIIVPAYSYPGTTDPYWPAMTQAAAKVPLTAIVNPGSGPGQYQDANYVTAVNKLRRAGARTIGYVHTSYSSRPVNVVKAEIDRYLSFYALDGFFIDEMSNQADSRALLYYRDIYSYIKGLNPNFLVIGNPGTNTNPAFLSEPTIDTAVIFESPKSVYDRYKMAEWVADYGAGRFAHLVYAAKNKKQMRKTVRTAVSRNARFVYVTNDNLNNPWDTLPPYWNAQVNCVARVNARRNC